MIEKTLWKAFKDIIDGKDTDDKPKEYIWHEHPEYPIEDERRFTVEVLEKDG